jgi:Flp pilus assembly pilin Flp
MPLRLDLEERPPAELEAVADDHAGDVGFVAARRNAAAFLECALLGSGHRHALHRGIERKGFSEAGWPLPDPPRQEKKRMLDLYTKLQARLAKEDGQTMAEYAVVLAVIAIGIFVALGVLSGAISGALSSVASKI